MKTVLALLVVAAVGAGFAVMYVVRHAEPILRKRVIETLSARFGAPVELDHLDIAVTNGFEVRGTGLRVLSVAAYDDPHRANGTPIVNVKAFSFRTDMRGLFRSPTRVGVVMVQGMVLHVPTSSQRMRLLGNGGKGGPKIELLVDRIFCNDAKIFIDTDKPGKDPLEFDIKTLALRDVGARQPFLYDADLTNPKPTGQIHAVGHFGPWKGEEPRATPLDGDYNFDHADLNSINGLGGILSSKGHFYGKLGHITIDGATDTPKFSLDVSDHPMPLTTTFHAYVDGTTGDTTLDPVDGTLGHTHIVARGTVMQVHGKGHDIALVTSVPRGNVQDVLTLGMKSMPPVMHGGITIAAKLHIPPGPVRVARKIELSGTVHIHAAQFSNTKIQDRLDSLSARASGHPKDAGADGSDKQAEVASEISTDFTLLHGMMTFPAVDFEMPGAKVQMHGAYTMDGNIFDFKGHVQTKATAWEMTTGWKAMLIKPFNKLLEKHGAGLELPIDIHGRGNDVHFGLAFGSADEKTSALAADVKAESKLPPMPKKKKKSK